MTDDLTKLRMIVSHASGGNLQYDPKMTVNDICVEISKHHNKVYQAGKDAVLRDRDQAL